MKTFKKQLAVALIAVVAVGIFAGCKRSDTEKAGDTLKDAATDTKDALKDAADKTGDALKDAAHATHDAATNAIDSMTSTNK